MGKNANKKAKFKPIVFEIGKDVFKKALTNAFSCTVPRSNGRTILNGINFKIDNEVLTLAATDGYTLIKQDLKVDEVINGGNYQIVLDGQYLYKAGFKKSYEFGRKLSMKSLDKLRITINEDSAIIEDVYNSIRYNIPALTGDKFPNYEKLIPKDLNSRERYTEIGFNTSLMARFADISNPKSKIGILRVNKEKPLNPMIITSENEIDQIKTTALLMPIDLRFAD